MGPLYQPKLTVSDESLKYQKHGDTHTLVNHQKVTVFTTGQALSIH